MQEYLSTTYGRFGIRRRFQQQLFSDFLFRYRLSLHELLQFLQVLVGIEGDALSFPSIPSGPSGFLIIAFQAFRHIIMNHKAHVRLVDTHTKRDGSYYHLDILLQKRVLIGVSRSRIHSRVIGTCLDTVGTEYLGQFFHLFAAQAINDTRFLRILLDELDDILVYIVGFRAYLVIQVRAVKRRLEFRSVCNTQTFLDIHLHFRSGRSGQRDDRCFPDFIDDRTDTTVFRTEIMSPFRNTMRLIHCIERNLHMFQEAYIIFLRQRFRSDIQQLGLSGKDICLDLLDGRLGQ